MLAMCTLSNWKTGFFVTILDVQVDVLYFSSNKEIPCHIPKEVPPEKATDLKAVKVP
jgi:hypothetical protein